MVASGPLMSFWPIAVILAAVNLAAFMAFGLDKARARRRARRIRERTLLLLALIGGTPGAYLGRWHFRHKTRKAAFFLPLHAIALGQVALLFWLLLRS